MAFALALQSVHDLPEGHGQTIFTATTAIVVLTVGKLFVLNQLQILGGPINENSHSRALYIN